MLFPDSRERERESWISILEEAALRMALSLVYEVRVLTFLQRIVVSVDSDFRPAPI
jgi:hypothetical protein